MTTGPRHTLGVIPNARNLAMLNGTRIRAGSSLFEPVEELHPRNSTKPEVTDINDRQFQVFDEIA